MQEGDRAPCAHPEPQSLASKTGVLRLGAPGRSPQPHLEQGQGLWWVRGKGHMWAGAPVWQAAWRRRLPLSHVDRAHRMLLPWGPAVGHMGQAWLHLPCCRHSCAAPVRSA